MISSRRLLSIVVALIVTLSLGAGIYLRIQKGNDASRDGDTGTDGARPAISAAETFSTDLAIPVEAAEVIRDTLVISVTAAGEAAAVRQTTMLAQVSGRVERLLVRENDRVTTSSLLLAVDSTELALEVARALAAKRSAEASYKETTLFDDRVEDARIRAERDAVARAKSGLGGAEVALRKAELDLSRTRVVPPFAGRVASLQVVPGQWVRTGDQLMTIVDLDKIKVEVQVLEGEVGYLTAGRSARVSFSALPDEVFTGRIETINPIIDQATRTAKVTVMVDNPGGRILPGMYARLSLDARRFPDLILVPRAAILERDRRSMLFVHENGAAKWRYVTTGLENESLIEIAPHAETQLGAPGEQVLVRGHYSLTHDAVIRIVQSVREAGGRPD
jgi:RND family efflux transporter MFP subunit